MNDSFSFFDCETGITSTLLQFDGVPIRIPELPEFTPLTIDYIRRVSEDLSGGKKLPSTTTRRLFFKGYFEKVEEYMREIGETPSDQTRYEEVKRIFCDPEKTRYTEKYELMGVINKILTNSSEVQTFLNNYPLYFFNVRGVVVFQADTLLGLVESGHHNFKFGGDVYKYVFMKILGEIVSSWEFRLEHLSRLQRLRIELEDFMVGVNSEYDVITDVKCWKLKTLIDETSPLNSYFDIDMTEGAVKMSFHGKTLDGKEVECTVEEKTDISKDLFEIKENAIPGVSYSNCIYVSHEWKRDFDLLFPVILELIMLKTTVKPSPETEHAVGLTMESFMESLRVVLANKVLISEDKIGYLVEEYLGEFLPPLYKKLMKDFLGVMFKVDLERRVKDYFVDDVREMLQILSQYELNA